MKLGKIGAGDMSNKTIFNKACDLFNQQDWTTLGTLLDDNVECHYLNPATPPTFTKTDFIYHQTHPAQIETFNPQNQWWNDDDTVVTGIGKWTDQNSVAFPVLFKFKFKDGLISYMWGRAL
jgi:hypothetical protein